MPRCAKDRSRGQAELLALKEHKANAGKNDLLARRRHRLPQIALGGIAILPLLALIAWLASDSPTLLRNQADAAARNGNWDAALRYWRRINATTAAHSSSYLGEARAYLALGRAGQAEHSLRKAISTKQSDLEPWQLLLEILLVEDRNLEVQRLGWEAYNYIRPEARRELLRTLTVGLLADRPDEEIFERRYVDGLTLIQTTSTCRSHFGKGFSSNRPTDPDRPSILAALEAILTNHPSHLSAREASITALGDAGETDRGRVLLDSWPESMRDARYWRLQGRWHLEYDQRPQHSIIALQTALVELPQDWRSWYRLARALHMLGRDTESQQAAEVVSRIREVLDPLVLEPRLHAAFEHVDDPTAVRDLAALCRRAGLSRLAVAWLAEYRAMLSSDRIYDFGGLFAGFDEG